MLGATPGLSSQRCPLLQAVDLAGWALLSSKPFPRSRACGQGGANLLANCYYGPTTLGPATETGRGSDGQAKVRVTTSMGSWLQSSNRPRPKDCPAKGGQREVPGRAKNKVHSKFKHVEVLTLSRTGQDKQHLL